MKYILLLCCFAVSICAHAQSNRNTKDLPGMNGSAADLPLRQHNLRLSQAEYAPATHSKTTSGGPGYIFDTSRWNHLVDSTWGAGLADTDKMTVFNVFWKQVDSFYACFINLPGYNWDSIVAAIDTQIIHGVSKGRFAAIGNEFMTLVNDGHSGFKDAAVNYPSMIYRGMPLFRGESGKFGASITTYNDTEALVYASHADHPFGLVPGDIILGYNSIPWTSLVKIILNKQLPNSVYLGSTAAATMHRYIQAAGENWYLFDTINIKKCDGSIVNLPTSLMTGVFYQDFCTEQMTVPGIHKVTYNEYYYSGLEVSYGVIGGKTIGYVYMYDCTDGTGNDLLNAVKTLVETDHVNGLILDIRTNFGGGFNSYIPTFEYLHNGDVSWVGYGDRYDANRMNLYNYGLPAWYDITDGDTHFFPHPVAVLSGPNAVSAGDFFPILFKHNPRVKVFGKSTAGAYGSYTTITVPFPGFYCNRQSVNFFKVGAATSYINHTEVPVDSSVWFNKDSVCAGIDNMVTTAIRWIEGFTTAVNTPVQQQMNVAVFPNPAHDNINISITGAGDEQVNIKLYNMLGEVVKQMNSTLKAGSNIIVINTGDIQLPPGNYHLILQSENGNKVVKKIAVLR